jgi:PhzF family phenazine biosynthesis protein
MEFMLIDAFAKERFTGNPAAVVLLDRDVDDGFLQALAMEFNQAETAYVQPRADGRFGLRWFTPAREVELCGHATLAAAKALSEWGRARPAEPVRFATRWHGELVCTSAGDRVSMDFPATPPVPAPCPRDIHLALGLPSACPVACVGTTGMNLTLRLPDEQTVLAAKPLSERLAMIHPISVTITAQASRPGVDFVSRNFAPAAGIPEDPVTGSAHCSLAPYWAKELGKTVFTAMQLSARGGWLDVRLMDDRVLLAGTALVTARGTIVAD